MDPNLMHSSSTWMTQYNTCFSVVTESLKISLTFLAVWTNLAHANFIAYYFNWFFATDWRPEICRRNKENWNVMFLNRKVYINVYKWIILYPIWLECGEMQVFASTNRRQTQSSILSCYQIIEMHLFTNRNCFCNKEYL